jgi:hypothetical protein
MLMTVHPARWRRPLITKGTYFIPYVYKRYERGSTKAIPATSRRRSNSPACNPLLPEAPFPLLNPSVQKSIQIDSILETIRVNDRPSVQTME